MIVGSINIPLVELILLLQVMVASWLGFMIWKRRQLTPTTSDSQRTLTKSFKKKTDPPRNPMQQVKKPKPIAPTSKKEIPTSTKEDESYFGE